MWGDATLGADSCYNSQVAIFQISLYRGPSRQDLSSMKLLLLGAKSLS